MRTAQQSLDTFRLLLQGKTYTKDHRSFGMAINWIRAFPKELKPLEKDEIRRLFCLAFSVTQGELDAELIGEGGTIVATHSSGAGAETKTSRELEDELDALLPKRGFLRRYVNYTLHSEAPLAYHVFSALCGVGSILNRRVYLDMGYYKLYPTLGIIILGPSGIKKTSAANITIDLLQSLGVVKIYSEKLTPEALIEAMKGENAVGMVYAPEMTVFLNKQKYNEGLVQLITRFMDCPDVWESGTIGRGNSVLHNIAISSLMCSTLDWFIRSTPEDSFGGGFIARNLLIVQEASPRCEPIPRPGDPNERERLIYELAYLHTFEGEMLLDKVAHQHYVDWYSNEHQLEAKAPEHELLSTYYNRKPDHIKRLAMVMHIVECGDLHICPPCFNRALQLLEWTEQFLPSMLQQMFKSQIGAEQEQVLRVIRNAGLISHSDLVRKMGYRMNAQTCKNIVSSLKEMNLVFERSDNLGHFYSCEVQK